MNSDALKVSPGQKEFYNHALNGRIISELGSSSFAFENVKGNQLSVEIPGVSNTISITTDDASGLLAAATEFTFEYTNSEATYTLTVLSTDPEWPALPFTTSETLYIWLADRINEWAASVSIAVIAVPSQSELLVYSSGGYDTVTLDLSADADWTYDAAGLGADVEYTNYSLPIQASDLKIIGQATTRDGWIIFTTDSAAVTPISLGQLWRIVIDDVTLAATITLLYNDFVNFSTKYPIQALTRYENSATYKVYWTDNYNYLRVFNFADSTNFTLRPDQLNTFPSFDFQPGILDRVVLGGALEIGVYQLAYKLKRNNGIESSVSRPSNVVPIYRRPDSDPFYLIQGEDYPVGTANPTSKRIVWTVPGVDRSFDYLEPIVIKRVNYTSTATVYLLDAIPISTDDLTVDYSGLENAEEISLEEYLLQSLNYFDTCKTISTSNNMLFAGNVRTGNRMDLDYDARAYRFLYLTDTTYTTIDLLDPDYWGVDPDLFVANPHSTEQAEWLDFHWKTDRYKYQRNNTTIGGEGPNISYRFVSQALVEDKNGMNFATNGQSAVNPGATVLGQNVLNDYTYNIDNAIPNMKSAYHAGLYRGYKRGETYRFGIVFFDKRGNPGYVKHIDDITFPRIYEDQDEAGGTVGANRLTYPVVTEISSTELHVNQLGIEFTVNIPPAISEQITGFSIVRVKRKAQDHTVLANGIIAPIWNPPPFDSQAVWDLNFHPIGQTPGDPSYSQTANQAMVNDQEIKDGFLYYSPELLFSNSTEITGGIVYKNGDVIYSDHYYTASSSTKDTETGSFNFFGVNKLYQGFGEISTNASINIAPFQPTGSSTPYSYYKDISSLTNVVRETGDPFSGPVYIWQTGQPVTTGFKNMSFTIDLGNTPVITGVGARTNLIGLNGRVLYNTFNGWRFYGDNTGWSAKWNADIMRFNPDQYGGLTNEAVSLNEFISTGHYQRVEASNTAQSITAEVYGGDTFANVWSFTKLHGQYAGASTVVATDRSVGFTYIVPVESSINTHLRHETHYNRMGMSLPGVTGLDPGTGDHEDFTYNSVYSCENDVYKYFAKPSDSTFQEINEYDNRVYASEIKVNGELTDAWSIFRQGNHIDLDGVYGPINNLVQYQNNLVAFQNRAICVLNVSPKFFISDTTGLEEAKLGQGKPLDGYNYISTEIGCRHQWGITKGNYVGQEAIFFYDIEKNKLFRFAQGQALAPISDLKGLNAYLRANVRGDILSADNPIEAMGITCAYDYRFNEAWFTFHMNRIPQVLEGTISGLEEESQAHAFTLSYSEPIQAFNSFYSFTPHIYLGSPSRILSNDPLNPNLLYMHHYGEYANFYGIQYPTTIKFTSNEGPTIRKALYSIGFIGEVIDSEGVNIGDDTWSRIRITTDYQNTDWVELTPGTNVARRERMWHLNGFRNQVYTANANIFDPGNMLSSLPTTDPRQAYPDRLRDMYFTIELEYDNIVDGTTHNRKIILPYVKTIYNQSPR